MVDRLVAVDDADYRLPEPVLGALATDVGNPATEIGQAVVSLIEESGAVTGDRGEALMTALDQKRSCTLAILSDSTGYKNSSGNYVGTDGREWPLQVAYALATRYNTAVVNYNTLATSSPIVYATEVEVSDGGGVTPGAVVLSDSFARTAATLNGTSPDVGSGTWAGGGANYTLPGDGTATAIATATATYCSVATTGYLKTVVEATINTESTGAVNVISSRVNTQSYLMVVIDLAADSIVFREVYGNVITVVGTGTFAAAGIPSTGTANVTITVEHKTGGTAVFTVGTFTATHTFGAGKSDFYTAATACGFSGNNNGHKFTSIEVSLAPSEAAADGTLTVRNGSAGSRDAQWSIAGLATLLPEKPDLVIPEHSHNHEDETPEEWQAVLAEVASATKALHGSDVGFSFASQNPQYAPTANAAAHNARMASLRRWCRENGYGYIPVYEAFMAHADPQSLVRADGVHPTAAGIDLIAQVVLAYLVALSVRPVT